MDTSPIPANPQVEEGLQRNYCLTLVVVNVQGTARLAYGEAVEVLRLSQGSSTPFSTPHQHGQLSGFVVRAGIDRTELVRLETQLSSGEIEFDGKKIRTGPLVRRELLIAGADSGSRRGASVHPDNRHTYELTEWHDSDEATLRDLWDTRVFSEFGSAIERITGLALHLASDRIGNFLRFDLRSRPRWRIDVMSRIRSREWWVRAVSADPGVARPMQARIHFGSGTETVEELLLPMPTGGARIVLPQGCATYSISLFDKESGRLVARSSGGFWGESVHTNMGSTTTASVTDSKGGKHEVKWTSWLHPTRTPLDRSQPWLQRASRRVNRSRQLMERPTLHLLPTGARSAALELIRDILAQRTADFVYIWDPYIDAKAVKDALNWLHPDVPCKVLGGNTGHTTPSELALFQAAIDALRQPPSARQVECKLRVNKRKRPIYHDRFIITRDAAWMLGGSLNGIGLKPTGIIKLLDADRFKWMFEDAWDSCPPGVREIIA